MPADKPESLSTIDRPLRLTHGHTPVVADLGRFFNPLADRGSDRPSRWAGLLSVPASTSMRVVGCVEVVARRTTVAATLAASGHPDLAARDPVMAVGTFTLGQVAALRHEGWFAPGPTTQPTDAIPHVR